MLLFLQNWSNYQLWTDGLFNAFQAVLGGKAVFFQFSSVLGLGFFPFGWYMHHFDNDAGAACRIPHSPDPSLWCNPSLITFQLLSYLNVTYDVKHLTCLTSTFSQWKCILIIYEVQWEEMYRLSRILLSHFCNRYFLLAVCLFLCRPD